MPPGRHEIRPLIDGKPKLITVTVTEATAKRVSEQLASLRSLAAAGKGDLPFFDFNHEDSASAGNPTEFYWGGDDPVTGGVRAKVEWSAAGKEAIDGRVFRRFSPAWDVEPKTGEILGIGVNVGGLVNRAAFRTIQPVTAKDGEPYMNDQDKQAIAALIADGIKPLTERITSLEAKATAAAAPADLENRIKALEATNVGAVRAQAKSAVEEAQRDGRIPAADENLAKFWENALVTDFSAAKAALAKLTPNPALARATGGAAGSDHGTGSPAEKFAQTVRAKTVELKSTAEALRVTMRSHPELHRAWLEADCKPSWN